MKEHPGIMKYTVTFLLCLLAGLVALCSAFADSCAWFPDSKYHCESSTPVSIVSSSDSSIITGVAESKRCEPYGKEAYYDTQVTVYVGKKEGTATLTCYDTLGNVAKTITITVEHNYVTKNKEPTCTEDGFSDRVVCLRCGAVQEEGTVLPALGHNPVPYNIPATCISEGKKGGSYCDRCGAVFEEPETVPLTSHNMVRQADSYTVLTPATCYSTGLAYYTQVCSVCGLSGFEYIELGKLPHTPMTIQGRAPSYGNVGFTDGVWCSVCCIWIQPQEEIPAYTYPPDMINVEETPEIESTPVPTPVPEVVVTPPPTSTLGPKAVSGNTGSKGKSNQANNIDNTTEEKANTPVTPAPDGLVYDRNGLNPVQTVKPSKGVKYLYTGNDPEIGTGVDFVLVSCGLGESVIRINGFDYTVLSKDISFTTLVKKKDHKYIVLTAKKGYSALRKQAGSQEKDHICDIPAGTVCPVLNIEGGWVKVDYHGTAGLINKAAVTYFGDQEIQGKGMLKGVEEGREINVRNTKSTGGYIVMTVTPEDVFTILGHTQGWYFIEKDGIAGYIQDKFVKVVEE